LTKAGRPTLYKPENGELARKFCMLGATNDDLADCFEVSRSTIDGWIATIPEFAEGMRQGRDEADAGVVEKLYSRAMGYSYETKKVLLCRGEPVTVPHTVHYPPDIRPASSGCAIAGPATGSRRPSPRARRRWRRSWTSRGGWMPPARRCAPLLATQAAPRRRDGHCEAGVLGNQLKRTAGVPPAHERARRPRSGRFRAARRAKSRPAP